MSGKFTQIKILFYTLFVFSFLLLSQTAYSGIHKQSSAPGCILVDGGAVNFTFTSVPFPNGPGTVTFLYKGDLDLAASEYFDFLDENNVNLGVSNATTQCGAQYDSITVPVTFAQLSLWVADGAIHFTADASASVNEGTCPGANCVIVRINYPFATGPNDAGTLSIDEPTSKCAGNHNIVTTIGNFGTNIINSVTINWSFNGAVQPSIPLNIPMDTFGGVGPSTLQVTIGNKNFLNGQSYDIVVWTSNPNNVQDQFNNNDTSKVNFRPALAGNFTVGGVNPDFTSFTDAVNGLMSFGICGPVTFNVRPGTYNEQIEIPVVSGSSMINTITFQAENGDSSSVKVRFNSSNANNNYVLQLNGSQYVRFRRISLNSLNTGFATVVSLIAGAGNNEISNCYIEAPQVSTTSLNVSVVTNPSVSSESNNLILNNRIIGGSYGIYLNANNSAKESGNQLINNQVRSYYYMGIYSNNQRAPMIISNDLKASGTYASSYGLYILANDSNLVISGNKIDQPNGRYGMYMSNCNALAGYEGLISNNFFHIGGTGTIYGLYILGSTQFQKFYNNTVHTTGGTTASRAIYGSANGVSNKLINNIAVASNGGYCIYLQNTSMFSNLDYNNYVTNGSIMGYYSSNVADLAQWQLSTGQESNSVSIDPGFYSSSDLHATNSGFKGLGTYLAEVPIDIDGDIRSFTSPDMGGDEFIPPPNDLAAIGFSSPIPLGCDGTTQSDITIQIYNNGTAPQTGFSVTYKIYAITVSTEVVGVTIQPGDTLDYTFNVKADLSYPDVYPFSGWLVHAGDAISANDSILIYPIITSKVIDKFPYITDFDSSLGSQPRDWINDPFFDGENWLFGRTTVGITADNTSGSGYFAYVDNSSPNSTVVNLLTPCLDFSTMPNPHLEFYYHNSDLNNSIFLHVDVLSNNGWVEDVIGPLGYEDGLNWGYYLVNLSSFSGMVSKIRFRGVEMNTNTSPDMGIDDVKIFNNAPINVGVIDILRPFSACEMTDIEVIQVEVIHIGFQTLYPGDKIPIAYSLNGGPPNFEEITLNDTLRQLETVLYTFTNPADFSLPDEYEVKIWTRHVLDDDFSNDTLTTYITSIPTIDQFPYVQDFENGKEGWKSGGTKSSWVLGTPNGNKIIGAASGKNAWGNGFLKGQYNDEEQSYVNSPCFDFSNVARPQISFDIWYECVSGSDGAVLQYTLDDGQTWLPVGNFLDEINWYNYSNVFAGPGGQALGWSGNNGIGSNRWISVKHFLYDLAGEPKVIFRIAFASDAFSNAFDGVAFDNMVIGETPQVGLTDMNDCGFVLIDAIVDNGSYKWSTGDTTKILLITNTGQTIVSEIYLYVEDENGLYNRDTMNLTLDAGPYVNLGPDTVVCGLPTLELDAENNGMAYLWDDNSSSRLRTVSTSNTYFVKVTSANNCVKSDTIDVLFEDFANSKFGFEQAVDSKLIDFSDSSSHGVTYYWDFGDGFNSDLKEPKHFYHLPGEYIVTLIISNGCGSDTTIKTVKVEALWPSGLSDPNQLGFDAKIYPNPSNGRVGIEINHNISNPVELIEITSQLGQTVYKEELKGFVSNQYINVDLTGMAKGIYTVKIGSEESYLIKKLIIQ